MAGTVLVPVILLGLLALVLVGLTAAVLGVVALVRINNSGGKLRGRGLAIAAIVIGALMVLAGPLGLVIGVPVFAYQRGESRKREMRAMEMEEEARAMALDRVKESMGEDEPLASTVAQPGALEIGVSEDDRFAVAGQTLDAAGLGARLKAEAGKAGEDKDGLSQLKVVISAHPAAPYGKVQQVMLECMKAKVWRVSFAPQGGKPVHTPLPRDKGPANIAETVRQMDDVTLRVRGAEGKPGTPEFRLRDWKTDSPAELVKRLTALRSAGDCRVLIDADPGCRFEHVISALDACAEARITKVEFKAPDFGETQP